MIAKKVPMNFVKKSNFIGLVQYITHDQNKNERVGRVSVTNCHSDQAEIAMLEVLNTQIQNTRAESDKTYHLILSFRAGEQPDDLVLQTIESRVCEGLGYGAHQRVSAVHHDTDNLHIHIAINKIHPTRYTMHEPYNDHKTLGRLCEKLEIEFDLERDNHQAQMNGAQNKAADMERHAGVESLLGWIQRECLVQLQSAQSWQELHQVMHDHGLEIRERGNGLVVCAQDGTMVKASSIGREYSKNKLEIRFGAFAPSIARVEKMPKSEHRETHDNHQTQTNEAQDTPVELGRNVDAEDLLSLIQRKCFDQMQSAQSWQDLHKVLHDQGIELRERGNGLAVCAQDGAVVKASSIGREFSKGKLEARFGVFVPSIMTKEKIRPVKTYQKSPIRSRMDTTELYGKYIYEQNNMYALRAAEWAKAVNRKNRLIAAAKRNGQLKRSVIKLIKGRGIGKKILYSATSSTVKNRIKKINEQYLKERQEIYGKYQRLAWADWLRVQARNNNKEALSALRARESAQGSKGNALFGRTGYSEKKYPLKEDSITKKGTIIYLVGSTAVRDDGNKLVVSRGSTQSGLQAALRMAIERYGERITVQGTDSFKEHIILAAVADKLPITFDDDVMQQRHQELLQSTTTKENEHEYKQTHRRSIDTGGASGGERAVTRSEPIAAEKTTTVLEKPNIGRIGRKPPPERQNRLRGLSELGMVRIASGSEVLLPSHVSGHMEQQRADSVNRVRRDVSQSNALTADCAAADKYIAEREKKRLNISDIPKHSRYNYHDNGLAVFSGVRQVDGQALALLRCGEEIMVLPVDEATVRRLKRIVIGSSVTVTTKGTIKTQGRIR